MSKSTTNLKERILHYLQEMQANEIVCLDVSEQTSITDEMIICNGRSSRHVKSIAEFVMEQMKHDGYPVISKSGLSTAEWALLDFGDVILHVMKADTRSFYNLEDLWQPDADKE